MRIPLQKVYRGFEELDSFSDAECERFVLRARIQKPIGLYSVLGSFAGIGVYVVTALIVWPVLMSVSRRPAAGLELFGPILTCGSAPLFAGMGALLTRDQVLIRAIRTRLQLVRCTNCKYNLLGLPVARSEAGEEHVACPECGSLLRLSAIGLTAADLIPRTAAEDS